MDHHGFGLVNGHLVHFRPRLQAVEEGLSGWKVRGPGVDGAANGDVIYVLPTIRGVSEDIVD